MWSKIQSVFKAPHHPAQQDGGPGVNISEAPAKASPWRWRLAPEDLLRNAVYRRLWTSILISSFGGQVTMLALPLTAAILLHATPTQMGVLTAVELLPFILFSLPSGVFLDRMRKLPVYLFGELALAVAVATIPMAWWLGWLNMAWMYAVGFVIAMVHTTAGTASQIVLTQVVPRERLVEAHARNALASSSAEVAGPGVAGLLIKLLGAPVALLVDAVMLVFSAAILRGVKVHEERPPTLPGRFWIDLKAGLGFVRSKPLLLTLAACVGGWQFCHQAATVAQILFATRVLGLSESAIGLSYVALGAGTVLASVVCDRISKHMGPGPCLVLGIGTTSVGWLVLSVAPVGAWGVSAFALMLSLFGFGAVLIFINFIALRQAVTPEPLLGRMTSTMRWLILLPAVPGALIGGWLGEHIHLRAALGFAGVVCAALAALAWRLAIIQQVKQLPRPEHVSGATAIEAATT